MDWHQHLEALLSRVQIRAWQLLLDTPEVRATAPMLRGVWGRALRHLDEEAYQRVFAGEALGHRRVPRYILRPAPPDPTIAPAIERILLGVDEELEAVLWRAWDVASGMGLGSERVPFRIRERRLDTGQADWPLTGDPATTPCCLQFCTPLRLLRRGVLLAEPDLAALATAAVRRCAGLAGITGGQAYRDLMRAVEQQAAATPAVPWRGERLDFVRWSSAQQRELNLRGVVGELILPAGPGPLWPLLAAACWTHIGKGAVFGLGQLCIAKS